MSKYDVTVVGAGPGGYVAAIRATQRGAKVALVEKESLGGTCLNWGCIPTKTLIASAEVLATINRASEFGITLDGVAAPDWPAMLKRKSKVVKGLVRGIGSLVKSNGIDLYTGTAGFVDRHTLSISDEAGQTQRVETTNTIIATGSDSVVPSFVPRASNVLHSRAALSAEALPNSILVLGGGVIGCEFACLYAELGVEVTLVEMLPEILPMVDGDLVRVVRGAMKELGITVLTSARMTDIEADGSRVTASVGDDTLEAECMLVCVGRRPVTDGLNLVAVGLVPDADTGLIPVNDRCRTKAPGVYAIGDVCSQIQLAHWASAQGVCAANNATGLEDVFDGTGVPSCIFTRPEIGVVGVTEAQAKDQGLSIKVGTFPFTALGKARAIQDTEGFVKVLADAETDRVVGVHIVGPHATDMVAEVATAMRLEVTSVELGRAIHAHPTLPEAIMEAAHAVHGECIHMPRPKRRS